ncbi:MAG: hypothetical protein JXJ20_05860 [Anaerolineae bacterium]|nr:hypothetical protein [Anaerolineae bacterium]
MDRTSRNIFLSLIAILILTGLALIASLLVPFDVEQTGTIKNVTGVVEYYAHEQEPAVTLDANQREHLLKPGNSLSALPGSTLTVTFFNNGRVVLVGPASLELVESYRRATVLGHALDSDRFDREYALTIEQTGGSARYFFANTDPAFEDVEITLELPNGNYTPDTPCWLVDISTAGDVLTEPFDCES